MTLLAATPPDVLVASGTMLVLSLAGALLFLVLAVIQILNAVERRG